MKEEVLPKAETIILTTLIGNCKKKASSRGTAVLINIPYKNQGKNQARGANARSAVLK
jgi:hypothetical protein